MSDSQIPDTDDRVVAMIAAADAIAVDSIRNLTLAQRVDAYCERFGQALKSIAKAVGEVERGEF
jgi:hypothetical protein